MAARGLSRCEYDTRGAARRFSVRADVARIASSRAIGPAGPLTGWTGSCQKSKIHEVVRRLRARGQTSAAEAVLAVMGRGSRVAVTLEFCSHVRPSGRCRCHTARVADRADLEPLLCRGLGPSSEALMEARPLQKLLVATPRQDSRDAHDFDFANCLRARSIAMPISTVPRMPLMPIVLLTFAVRK